MTKKAPKQTLLQIDNVRIKESDAYNLIVERYEKVYNPIKKENSEGWRFKGFNSSNVGCLKLITKKDLLIDEKAVSDLNGHLKQVRESERKMLDAIEGLK